MKYSRALFLLTLSSALSASSNNNSSNSKFMTTVQMAVRESPELMKRSENVVLEEVSKTFDSWPQLSGKHYEVRKMGNEIFFNMVSDEDVRDSMPQAMAAVFQRLHGRAHVKGVYKLYRASLSEAPGAVLDVDFFEDDIATNRIRSIIADYATLGDLLSVIQAKLEFLSHGESSFSYFIPGECARRTIVFSFRDPEAGLAARNRGMRVNDSKVAKNVGQKLPSNFEKVMRNLAVALGLKLDIDGTYIFRGTCSTEALPPRQTASSDYFRGGLSPVNGVASSAPQVFFPVSFFSE